MACSEKEGANSRRPIQPRLARAICLCAVQLEFGNSRASSIKLPLCQLLVDFTTSLSSTSTTSDVPLNKWDSSSMVQSKETTNRGTKKDARHMRCSRILGAMERAKQKNFQKSDQTERRSGKINTLHGSSLGFFDRVLRSPTLSISMCADRFVSGAFICYRILLPPLFRPFPLLVVVPFQIG